MCVSKIKAVFVNVEYVGASREHSDYRLLVQPKKRVENMTSRYSVIQYRPNPIADERINIGVLAFDDETVRVHFLSRWDRVRCFGISEDISFLRDFAHRMKQSVENGLLFPGDKPDNLPKHERLIEVSKNWANSIQITQPCGSLENVDALLDDVI
jgi:Protein of unknown function (DUF3037)